MFMVFQVDAIFYICTFFTKPKLFYAYKSLLLKKRFLLLKKTINFTNSLPVAWCCVSALWLAVWWLVLMRSAEHPPIPTRH